MTNQSTITSRQPKVAWIRNSNVPIGQPALGRLRCPCKNAPESKFNESQGDVVCNCGRVYSWNGWIRSEPITVTYCNDWNSGTGYKLTLPITELGNCIALCGWTITNEIEKTPAIREEIEKLNDLPYLDIPDGREWFEKYGVKFNFREG